jgi:hypothetical protein
MNLTEAILGGVIISIISLLVGKFVGGQDKVTTKQCNANKESCNKLMHEKLENILKEVKNLKEIVNSKILGI